MLTYLMTCWVTKGVHQPKELFFHTYKFKKGIWYPGKGISLTLKGCGNYGNTAT